MPCCQPRAAYKQRVARVFPPSPDAPVDKNEVTKLLYYATVNSDKLPKIASYLEKRVRNELAKKRYNQALNGAYTFNALVKTCHRDMRLFYPQLAGTMKALLKEQRYDARIVAVELFDTFSDSSSGATPLQSDIDELVSSFLDMASNNDANEDVRQNQRFAGLRGLRAYFALMDDHLARLTTNSPRLLPTIFENLRYDAPPVKIVLNLLSVEANADAEEEQQTIRGLAV